MPCLQLQEPDTEDKLSGIFDKYAHAANAMDAGEFMQALNTST